MCNENEYYLTAAVCIRIHTGEKQKLIQPTSLKEPQFEKLKEVRN